jgi:hypothetical protein
LVVDYGYTPLLTKAVQLDKAYGMDLTNILFPRRLETDGVGHVLRRVLTARLVKLWPGSDLHIPMIVLNGSLQKALRTARLQGRLQWGFETILDKLDSEKKGIDHARRHCTDGHVERMSRLLLFSNDGAERFYRHGDQLLQTHASRVFGCLLDADGLTLGRAISGQDRTIKAVMVDHKEGVCDVLQAIADSGNGAP